VLVVRSRRIATGTVGRNLEIKDDDLGFVASNQLVRPGQFPTQNLNDYNGMSPEKLIKR